MSDLVVVGYADRDRAGSVLHALRTLDSTWADRNDMVAVARDRKGNLRIAERAQIVTGRAVAWSTLWLGLVHSAGAPDAGAPVVVARHAGSVGLPERFVRAVGEMVERGNSAIIIRARTSVPPHVHEYLYASAGDVQWAPLFPPQDALLASVLDVVGPVAEIERS